MLRYQVFHDLLGPREPVATFREVDTASEFASAKTWEAIAAGCLDVYGVWDTETLRVVEYHQAVMCQAGEPAQVQVVL